MDDSVLYTSAVIGLIRFILSWLLFSVGLFRLLKKLNYQRRWLAWVPGLRYYALGASVEMPKEGMFNAILEIVIYIVRVISDQNLSSTWALAMQLLSLVLSVLLLVYRIRLFLRVIDVFGLR